MSADSVTAFFTAVGALATVGAAGAAFWAVYVAKGQLSNLTSTLKMNALAVVLQLEAEMNARKEKVDQVHAQIRKEAAKTEPDGNLLDICKDEMEGYLENWLNAADRLAYCILRGYLAERDWKTEYRDCFQGLVKNHPEKFGPGTMYTNILDLNEKWRRE